MTTLAADVTATETLLPVDAELVNGTFDYPMYYVIDSEVIVVVGGALGTSWLVDRGQAGTTPASHLSGANADRYYPDAAPTGGGSAAILTGTETQQRTIYVGDEDPEVDHLADLISGDLWRDTTGGSPYSTKERNEANDDWTVAPLVVKGVAGDVKSIVSVSDGGAVFAEVYDQTDSEQLRAQINLDDQGNIALEVILADGSPSASLSMGLGAIVTQGNLIVIGLPTADPVNAGQLWNDTGTVKVSAG